jgi:peptidoglycan hydrolase-like protein with peptidoglycan-binding domain
VFLDVKPLHQKPPRNPAWIAAILLIVLSVGVLAFFKLRSSKTAPTPPPTEQAADDPFPNLDAAAPVNTRAAQESATFSLSPVVGKEETANTEPESSTNAQVGGAPPRLDLPTMRSSANPGMTTFPAPASPAPPTTTSTPDVSTIMSAPRVPGMLTARLSGKGAESAPQLDTSLSRASVTPRSTSTESPAASQTPSTPASAESGVSPSTTATAQAAVRLPRRPVRDAFEAQLALDQQGISAGSIDGVYGSQTRLALLAFQQRERLPMTGRLDDQTKARLRLVGETHRYHTVSAAELQSLAPGFDWNAVAAGARIRTPNAVRESPRERAAFLRIRLGERTVQAFNQDNRLIAHYPCSIAASFANRPQGQLKVTVLVEGPNYTFDPKRFPNTPEARFTVTKLILPPGPNNPVGAAWIGLDALGYGIHGTPEPEKIGKTGSLGCFRLANWNAEHLVKMSWVGMPVIVVR